LEVNRLCIWLQLIDLVRRAGMTKNIANADSRHIVLYLQDCSAALRHRG
jgi:hypothetical protein